MGPAEERAVLLCDGKLRLSTIQQMFGLYLVEMLHSKLAPEHPLPLPANDAVQPFSDSLTS